MNITIDSGIKLITKAYEGRTNERLMERWLIGGYEKEISFNDFRDKLYTHRTSTNKTDDEILEDVRGIIKTFNEKVVK